MTKASNGTWSEDALAVWSVLGDRPVAFHPALARALGDDVGAALFLGQIMYWGDKGTWDPDYVAKTQAEIYHETALTRSQQERIRKKLVALGVLKEKLKGVPARLWFKVNYQELTRLLVGQVKDETPLQSRKPAIKDAGNPQTEPGEPATKDAGNPQTISETSHETTPEDTTEKSAAKAAPVLDAAFPDSAAVDRSGKTILDGNPDDLSAEQRAQIASPVGSEAPGKSVDRRQLRWQEYCRRITFPYSLTWHDIYAYALLFSELFGIPLPLTRNGVGQWRHGIVQGLVAYGEALQAASPDNTVPWPSVLVRRARWGLQVLHARRELGDAWTFDIVSPTSTANTLRVIAGDLHKMEKLYETNGDLPSEAQILQFYASKPQSRNNRAAGSDITANAVAELAQMGV